MLSSDSLGISDDLHTSIYEQEKTLIRQGKYVNAQALPDILKVTNSTAVVEVCTLLAGEDYAIVPFTHNTPFMSGGRDQAWHKDDNGPFNLRKQRHHQLIQLEMLYFPQAVKMDMGPTATVPYSQYWTFDHEENFENFAGADHLDFDYQLSGMEAIPVSGPKSDYSRSDIVNRNTAHDRRMSEAVTDLKWPLCQTFEVGPLDAGSVILYSHNLIHRGNHRRDDYSLWKENPRFMWRFWIYRTHEPNRKTNYIPVDWLASDVDSMTGQNLSEVNEDMVSVWRTQHRWLETGQFAGQQETETQVDELVNQLACEGDELEPQRIGAAYQLAEHRERKSALAVLIDAMRSERECTRRAGLFGVLAMGPDASQELLTLSQSKHRWVRRAATFALGTVGEMNEAVVQTLSSRLLTDESAYVRSVAADALGCFGRRAVCNEADQPLVQTCAEALVASLELEVNRLGMDRAQGKSIKFVRPTEDCDVCEGIGIDYKQDRYEPVRSVVRENVLWAMVILSSHGESALGSSLDAVITSMTKVVAEDKNVFSVGLAMDVLQRLVAKTPTAERSKSIENLNNDLAHVFSLTPIHSLEALVSSGMSAETAISSFAGIGESNLFS